MHFPKQSVFDSVESFREIHESKPDGKIVFTRLFQEPGDVQEMIFGAEALAVHSLLYVLVGKDVSSQAVTQNTAE